MDQPNRFQRLVADAKQRITEISVEEAEEKVTKGEAVLIDVREKSDWDESRAAGAYHLSRGTVELEIEEKIPNVHQPIICYCGGGSRSALTADSLQKMGYTNVRSLAGGLRRWKEAGLPVERD